MKLTEKIKKPDNPFWSKVGNIAAIVGSPVGTLLIMIFVPAPFKDEAVGAWVAIMAAIKAATKLTTNETTSK